MVEIKQLAVIVKKKKKSSSLLKQRSAYLLSNYSANQGNHTSFKMIDHLIPLTIQKVEAIAGWNPLGI